jgi:hypothetical protein
MKYWILFSLSLALPFSLRADDDAFRSLVRGILAPPVEESAAPAKPKVVQQYPFNPDYADIYLGDDGATNVSVFVEAVYYGSTADSYFILLTGKSSKGNFQKKLSFTDFEVFQHFQVTLEQKQYDRLYFYSDGRSVTDFTLQKKPTRKAPRM